MNYISEEEYRQECERNVARGVAFMNYEYPGWYWGDLAELDMSASDRCILGHQGYYTDLVTKHSGRDSDDSAWEVYHGFVYPPSLIFEERSEDQFYYTKWTILQEVWEKRIQELRNENPFV